MITYVAFYYSDDNINYSVGHVREIATDAVRGAKAQIFRNHTYEAVKEWVKDEACRQYNENVEDPDEHLIREDITLFGGTATDDWHEVIGYFFIREFM
jgi:hypothetical protein